TYNALFDHLDDEKAKLGRKKKTWKKELMPAIEAAIQKLKNYYNATGGKEETLYNVAAILNPTLKLQTYNSGHWEKSFKVQYMRAFMQHFRDHYHRADNGPATQSASSDFTCLAALVQKRRQKTQSVQQAGEDGEYLRE
ncbi:MAG: hypothetical protein M1823_007513, partial [Watsoniomyces obsoletus]